MKTKSTLMVTHCLVGLCVCLGLAATAGAATFIDGYNSVLDGTSGRLFVPLSAGTSGLLGDPITATKSVGLNNEIVTVTASNPAEGWVEFVLQFDFSGGGNFDPTSFFILLDAEDIDFKPVTVASGKGTHTETLELTFMRDASDTVLTHTPLLVNELNFGYYRQDIDPGKTGFEMPTNNYQATYGFSLMGDLGATQADFTQDVGLDYEFALLVRVTSRLESNGARFTLNNTDENIEAQATYIAPEPGSALLMLLGATVLRARRRRRK